MYNLKEKLTIIVNKKGFRNKVYYFKKDLGTLFLIYDDYLIYTICKTILDTKCKDTLVDIILDKYSTKIISKFIIRLGNVKHEDTI